MEQTRTYSGAARTAKTGELVLVALLPGGFEAWTLPRRGKVAVGRLPSCDVVVDHASISREHATLELGARVLVREHGSRNGTRIDGISLGEGEAAELVVGGTMEIGDVTFLLQRRGAEPMAEGAPQALSIGDHQALLGGTMERTYDLVRRVALGDLTVLVVGETGVGKDLVAELVHRASPRARGPFVRVHCAALTLSLFESELFGHERGAFTGATQAKRGLVDTAEGGTLFLDEIGEIPMAMQVKLLRVLEDRRVTRVGSTTARKVDVRFVAATNRDLALEVDEGRFREDLYYRISGFTVAVPPLRERSDEIVPLAELFLEKASGGRALSFGQRAREALVRHPFPGNVRELRLTVERAAALAGSNIIEPEDLDLDPEVASEHEDCARILEALEAAAGNQSEAARRLGMSRRTLVSGLAEIRKRGR